MILPTMVAIVGRMTAPHKTRVTDIGSDKGAVSAGMRWTVLESVVDKKKKTANTLNALQRTRINTKFRIHTLICSK